jgi:hypothetical protein
LIQHTKRLRATRTLWTVQTLTNLPGASWRAAWLRGDHKKALIRRPGLLKSYWQRKPINWLASEHRFKSKVLANRAMIRRDEALEYEGWPWLYSLVFFRAYQNSFRWFHSPRFALRAKSLAFAHAHSMRSNLPSLAVPARRTDAHLTKCGLRWLWMQVGQVSS